MTGKKGNLPAAGIYYLEFRNNLNFVKQKRPCGDCVMHYNYTD